MELMTSWEQIGRLEGLQHFVLRLLRHRVGALSKSVTADIKRLSVEQLEDLGIASDGFSNTRDLTHWLQTHTGTTANKNSSITKAAAKRKAA